MSRFDLHRHVVVEHRGSGDRVLGELEPRASHALMRARDERSRGRDVDVYRLSLVQGREPELLERW